jgi:sialidase-1
LVSISSNGGETWDTTYFDNVLIDPVNQGSILTIGKKKGKAIVAFCNAADTKRRDNLTLRISYDDGRTWKKNFTIDKAGVDDKKDFTAYSDLVKISKNKIGILYERDGYMQIVFSVIDWENNF